MIVPSQALKNEIVASGYIEPDSVEVIPIGIPDAADLSDHKIAREHLLSEFGLPSDSIIAVTVGRYVEHKGHRYLIAAAKEIVRKLPAIRFLFLGDGPLESDLKRQIESAGLENYFLLAGMRSDVAELLPGVDLMIHPSIQEPFGIAVLEGMRAGLPVVASRIGGIPEVVAEGVTAILCEAADPFRLASAVLEAGMNRSQMSSMGKAGRQRWSESFRYEHMIERVEESFRRQVRIHEV